MFPRAVNLYLFAQFLILILCVVLSHSFNRLYPRTKEDIDAVFKKHKIVPDVISQAPEHLMRIDYLRRPTVDVDYGNTLNIFQMEKRPLYLWWPHENEEFYTLIMTDPDAPTAEHPFQREWQHWIIVNIPECHWQRGEEITQYLGMIDELGQINSKKRYVFLVWKHPFKKRLAFDEPYTGQKYDVFRDSNIIDEKLYRANFSTRNFIKKYNFSSKPWAGNFCYGFVKDEYVKPTDYHYDHPYDFWKDETWDPTLE